MDRELTESETAYLLKYYAPAAPLYYDSADTREQAVRIAERFIEQNPQGFVEIYERSEGGDELIEQF